MRIQAVLAATFLLLSTAQIKAQIPYPNAGNIAATNDFTAITTGEVTGEFVLGGGASGGNAGDLDFVQLVDVTQNTFSGFLFNNQTTTAGTTANFLSVNAGDTLEIELENTAITTQAFPDGIILSSNPADSNDGVNHVYATPWGGGTLNNASIPAGLFIGTEDLPVPGSDLNYNDDTFVFQNVQVTSATPEPASLLLFGSGLLLLAGLLYKKSSPLDNLNT